MIEEAYVSFETAKLLKKQGFNQRLRYYYDEEGILIHCRPKQWWDNDVNHTYLAPTQQMAMRWLREAHNLHIEIYVAKNFDKSTLEYNITVIPLEIPGTDDGIELFPTYIFKTYEECCEEAIKYCLNNLI